MVIVIDGYNVLKQLHDEIVSSEERSRYITTLKRYAKKKTHTIILVFDAYVKQALGKLPIGVEIAETEAQKLRPEQKDEELDTLMQEASMMIERKPEEDLRDKRTRRRKDFIVSKKDRKIMDKLKKL